MCSPYPDTTKVEVVKLAVINWINCSFYEQKQTGEQGIALENKENRPRTKTMIMIMIRWNGLDQLTPITKTTYKKTSNRKQVHWKSIKGKEERWNRRNTTKAKIRTKKEYQKEKGKKKPVSKPNQSSPAYSPFTEESKEKEKKKDPKRLT